MIRSLSISCYGARVHVVDLAGAGVCVHLRDLLAPEAREEAGDPDVRYEVHARTPAGTDGWVVARDGRPGFTASSVEDVVQRLRSDIDFHVAVFAREGLFVHAGVVGWRNRAIVVPGRSLTGKTRLIAELVRHGALYYSDEYAVIGDDGWVRPYARPWSLRGSSHGSLARAPGPAIRREPLPVSLVVSTSDTAAADWRPETVTGGRAVLPLVANTVLARRDPERMLHLAAKLAPDLVALQGPRPDAEVVAPYLLQFLDDLLDRGVRAATIGLANARDAGGPHSPAERRAHSLAPTAPTDDRPVFVSASRTAEDAARIRARLESAGQDVFVSIGARSILEAYEAGREYFAGRTRIVYAHDDVQFNDLPAFLAAVAVLPDGLHGVCGSAAPDALDRGSWWQSPPLVGRVTQLAEGKVIQLDFEQCSAAHEASWLDGLCLVAVRQAWSWRVPGDPPVWHGYDWLACRRTREAGGRCSTMAQPDGSLLSHAGHGRTEGLDDAMRVLRSLTREARDRRDWANIHEHLPRLAAEAHGTVLELGSRDGSSTAALLVGVSARGGEVWSVDNDPAWADAWRGHPRWRFFLGDSADAESIVRAGLPLPVDVLLVDSSHTYEQTKAELAAWIPRMRAGGTVLMHDTESFPDVKRAMLEAVAAHGLTHELHANGNGLGVIRMPGGRMPRGPADASFVVLDAGSGLVGR